MMFFRADLPNLQPDMDKENLDELCVICNKKAGFYKEVGTEFYIPLHIQCTMNIEWYSYCSENDICLRCCRTIPRTQSYCSSCLRWLVEKGYATKDKEHNFMGD